MRTLRILLLTVLTACVSVPETPRPTTAGLPVSHGVARPCALVHVRSEESLSNGAAGWFRGPWQLAYASFVVRLPGRIVLIDAGLGDHNERDVDAAPLWFQWGLGNATRKAVGLGALLRQVGIAPEEVTDVLLTHPHWDHAGGLRDLPRAKVWLSAPDARVVLNDRDHPHDVTVVDGAMPQQFEGLAGRIQRLAFAGPPLLGLSASQDIFGDGSVIALPTQGHTPGATSFLVQRATGKPWLFIGDAAWVREGFAEPAPKGRIASMLSDFDRDQTADTLGRLHAIHAAGLATLVTAHDERTWVDVPACVR